MVNPQPSLSAPSLNLPQWPLRCPRASFTWFPGHCTFLFFCPVLLSSAGSFSFPDLCSGDSSRCHLHSLDDLIQCPSFKKTFLLRTSKCTNAAQAFSCKAAHSSSCSLLLLLRHPACVSNKACLALNTQSSPKTCLLF